MLDVLDFGAVGDGQTIATESIQAAIDEAALKHEELYFPKGEYLVGSIFLREASHVIFEEGATLKGIQNIKAYPKIQTRIAGVEMLWPAAILNAIEVNHVIVEGKGIIDGQGEFWWDLYWGTDHQSGERLEYDQRGQRWIADYLIERPRACLIYKSNSSTVKDITFRRSGFWNLQITYSDQILVEKVTVKDNYGPSTDGIDIDSSTNVRVTHCSLSCADDCIVVKSGRDGDGLIVNKASENIEIDHCKIYSGYGITLGSEVSAGLKNIHIHDIEFTNSSCGFRMKSAKERGACIENIHVENLKMSNVQFVFSWIMDWHNAYNRKDLVDFENYPESWKAVAAQIPEKLQMTRVKNIVIESVTADLNEDYQLSARAFDIVAFPEKPMEDIVIKDSKITATEFGRIVGVDNLQLENVSLSIKKQNDKGNDLFDNR